MAATFPDTQTKLARSLTLLLLGSFLAACATGATNERELAPRAAQVNSAGGQSESYDSRTIITRSGDERKYLFRLPVDFRVGDCVDVLFDFHGAGGTAAGEFNYTGFAELADREGVILIYPDANKIYVDQEHRLASYWNSAWEAVKRERNYDVDFILELVDRLKSEYCTTEFFATGMSAGGDMTSALACLAETPFKSFAPVTYRYYYGEECVDAGPRPIISFQGDADRVVPIEGSGDPWFDPPMVEIMRRWSVHNKCDIEPVEERISDEVLRYFWRNCTAATEWYLVEGGGHSWPGSRVGRSGRVVTQDISATELIWEFFKQ